jgi:hypothetical protein
VDDVVLLSLFVSGFFVSDLVVSVFDSAGFDDA